MFLVFNVRYGFKWQGRIGFRQSCLAKGVSVGRKSAKPVFFPLIFFLKAVAAKLPPPSKNVII
jgi:hypothetical protein